MAVMRSSVPPTEGADSAEDRHGREQHAEDETTLGSSGRMPYRLDGEACATTVTTPDNTRNHNGHNGRSETGTLFDLIDLPSPEDLEGNGFALRVNGRI